LIFSDHLKATNVDQIKIESLKLDQVPLEDALLKDTASITKQIVRLDNGAEGYFLKLSDAQ